MEVLVNDIKVHLEEMLANNSISINEKDKLINRVMLFINDIKSQSIKIVTKTEYDKDINNIFHLVSETKNKLNSIIDKYNINHYSLYENRHINMEDLEPNYTIPVHNHIEQLEEIEKTLDWNFNRIEKISHPSICTERDRTTRTRETILKAIIYFFKSAKLEKLISSSTYNQDTNKEYDFYKLYRLICNYAGIFTPQPTTTKNGGKTQIDNYFNNNCKRFMKIYSF
ncbi:hypothetical protein [Francisella salina]|uniref:Uncharacterized protein n=1 Tax=Francisella salina TaxID=573569 RepID=A0ABM5M8M2_FRAST|nr:hypothetical protein [Francisella salina]AEI35510.1 hypothetical protein F7308_0583 [Francisella salina]